MRSFIFRSSSPRYADAHAVPSRLSPLTQWVRPRRLTHYRQLSCGEAVREGKVKLSSAGQRTTEGLGTDVQASGEWTKKEQREEAIAWAAGSGGTVATHSSAIGWPRNDRKRTRMCFKATKKTRHDGSALDKQTRKRGEWVTTILPPGSASSEVKLDEMLLRNQYFQSEDKSLIYTDTSERFTAKRKWTRISCIID